MSKAAQSPSATITAGLAAAHLSVTPVVTWAAIVYSTLGAPWRAVYALWYAQVVLLGICCGLSAAPLQRRLGLSLAGLLWLAAMPAAKQLFFHGVPPLGLPWSTYALAFGLQPLFLVIEFAAAVGAIVFVRTVFPRCRLMTAGADSQRAAIPQYSMSQLMLAVVACTPLLLAARLTHDYVDLGPRNPSTFLLDALVECPLPAVVALLSIWAALGRTYVIARLAVALLSLPLAVLLMCYATKVAPSEIIGRVSFEEMKMAVTLITLLICRWNGYRIGTIPARSPFS